MAHFTPPIFVKVFLISIIFAFFSCASDVYDTNSKEEAKDMVLVKDISAFSFCEHHIALMYDMKISIAYIPMKKP